MEGSAFCKTAPVGHRPASNRDYIEQCPKDTFSIGASDDCINCDNGGHSRPGSSACEKCATGKYYNEAEIRCDPCPKNTFTISGAADISGCEPCQNAGEHAPEGSGYCQSCTSGKYYHEPANDCLKCPSGSFTATGGVGLDECKQCPEGFHSEEPGAATCFACPAGKYASADQTECIACSAGKISGVASSSCTSCEIGKFAEGEGNVECQFCNKNKVLRGSTTAGYGTTSSLGCICPKGEYKNHNIASCEKVGEGVKVDVEGMNVTTLDLKKGYWR